MAGIVAPRSYQGAERCRLVDASQALGDLTGKLVVYRRWQAEERLARREPRRALM